MVDSVGISCVVYGLWLASGSTPVGEAFCLPLRSLQGYLAHKKPMELPERAPPTPLQARMFCFKSTGSGSKLPGRVLLGTLID